MSGGVWWVPEAPRSGLDTPGSEKDAPKNSLKRRKLSEMRCAACFRVLDTEYAASECSIRLKSRFTVSTKRNQRCAPRSPRLTRTVHLHQTLDHLHIPAEVAIGRRRRHARRGRRAERSGRNLRKRFTDHRHGAQRRKRSLERLALFWCALSEVSGMEAEK